MFRTIVAVTFLTLLAVAGCAGRPNRASQAVDIDPSNWGTGRPVVTPSNSYGYYNGESMDTRR